MISISATTDNPEETFKEIKMLVENLHKQSQDMDREMQKRQERQREQEQAEFYREHPCYDCEHHAGCLSPAKDIERCSQYKEIELPF